MKRFLLALGTVLALALPGTAAATVSPCTTTVSSVTAAQSAVSAASPGSTVCLTDGTYGRVNLDATKAAPGVKLQAEHPGQATIAGTTMEGTNLTVAQFRVTHEADIGVGSVGMTVDHNFFDLNAYSGYGVMACGSSSTQCSDIAITNNRFVGRSEEDAIRANRYHDTADADPYGLLIEGNEFTGNQETGEHNDVFQSVWVGDGLYFRRNYLHDFGGQGFFVKDQATAVSPLVSEDNLIVNQNLPCDPPSLCSGYQLSPFQVFGPVANVSMRHNTVGWSSSGQPSGGTAVLTGSYSSAVFSDNVFNILSVTNSGGGGTVTSGTNNTRCTGNSWPAPAGTTDGQCAPAFIDPANGDYRQANGRGVTWRVADQQYGPETGSGPPPPPADTTPPDTAITNAPSDSTSDTATVSFTGTDDVGVDHFDCSLDGQDYAPCTSPKTYSNLGVGPHAVDVKAVDAAGNVDPTPASASWVVSAPEDTTPPQTTITSAPSSSQSTSASVSFSADEPSTFECKLDAGAYAACTSPKAYSGLSVGSHTVSVRATDAAGNTDASPATATWTVQPVDQTPVARFTWTPTSPARGQQVTFNASTTTCGDAPCTYAWQDDGPNGPSAPNWALGTGQTLRFTFSGSGTKYVRLTVTDADGDTSTVKHNVTVR